MTTDKSDSASASEPMMEVRYEFTPVLADILSHIKASLMVTTYQAGKLLVLGVHNKSLRISFASYEQPMGLAIDRNRMALGTRRQMNFLQGKREVAASVEPKGTWDICFVPRTSTWTGNIHGHDLAWGNDGLWVVNTLFSCLCTLHEDYSFVPRWKPRFISQLADQDRCHLNGLAMKDGQPAFVSAMSETDTPAGWRPNKATSGVLIDVASGETISRGLAMPHSPRWYQGRLWVLDSGCGALATVDLATGKREVVEKFPGYVRGLSFLGQFAFVGLSKIRETSIFGGVPIAEDRHNLKCGVGVVDLISGRTVAVFQFLSGVTEIFAVEVAQGSVCPYVAGASTDGKEHDVWVVPPIGKVPAVSTRPPWFSQTASSAESRQQSIDQSELKTGVPVWSTVVSSVSPVAPAASTAVAPQLPSANTVMARPETTRLEDWLEHNPNDAASWITLGNLRQEQDRQSDAIVCYERAVSADPRMAAARQNLGYLLFNHGYPERAMAVYDELLTFDASPMNRLLASSVLPTVYRSNEDIQRWRQRQHTALQRMVDDGVVVDASRNLVPTTFFWAYQGLNDVALMNLRGSVIRGSSMCKSAGSPSPDGRLRVGFLSAYFRNHTIGRLNIGRIEQLDRSKFHVTVCSAFAGQDEFTQRFRQAADSYVVVSRDVSKAIEAIRSLDLDVLVFADVGMDALCSTLAFSRMAPVQCVTWGHPETTGSREMDYFLSSELLDLPSAQEHYSERLIRMPLTGTWYERPAEPAVDPEFRKRVGLPTTGSLYVCPQTLFKIHPDDDVLFRRILEQDTSGHLIMIDGRVSEWTSRLKARWSSTMASVFDRCLFLPSLPHPDFLRLLQVASVVLDPLHFGGGNSSYEALAMGAPVVTLPGEFLRSRITQALYATMGFQDLVVSSIDEYTSLAVRLANDAEFRAGTLRSIQTSSHRLFENAQEVRCLEDTLLSLRNPTRQ